MHNTYILTEAVAAGADALQQRLADVGASHAAAERDRLLLREQLAAALEAARSSNAAAASAATRADALEARLAELSQHGAEVERHNEELAAHLVRARKPLSWPVLYLKVPGMACRMDSIPH